MANSLSAGVGKAIAEAKEIDMRQLDMTLYDHIDLEAVEQLADHTSAPWTLSFELPEHDVTVTSDGAILVDGRRETVWA